MKKVLSAIALAAATLATLPALAADYFGGIYTSGADRKINVGDKLYSPNQRYMMTFGYDGRLVTYRLSDYKVVYQSPALANLTTPYALIRQDVSLGVYTMTPYGQPMQMWNNGSGRTGQNVASVMLSLKDTGQLQLAGPPHPGSPYPDTIYWSSPRDYYP